MIDVETAMLGLHNSKQIYFIMLEKFGPESLIPQLTRVCDELNKNNYQLVSSSIDATNSATGYIGASRIFYSTEYIMEAYRAKKFDRLREAIPSLIEASCEFLVERERLVAENKIQTGE
eukprot:CAMPEP_0176349392 /NCGR_PEP_ID=MMETSP0126-20121128/8618_1 /TAXON_ID=141414 ORGANISM="Strombidinopsis acuminatum, Strain SPMC142" /NCGR_SAMPLE_ID=MMETSP0126 /ASSEMBLY_ACC=CAM_ASM_000229 /LENGTH=118 /DNA_ID=CAMNT_0017698735 /DNA_START=199 /DNA_END=555 /DNA_ORIENTATION=+